MRKKNEKRTVELRGIWKEFREFALRGNVVDLAVGVIIGGAFGKIITSLVSDILMPLLGLLLGQTNLRELSVTLREADEVREALVLGYGAALQNIIDFIFIAVCIFFFVKAINLFRIKSMREAEEQKKQEAEAQKAEKKRQKRLEADRDAREEEQLALLREIAESLRKQR